MNAERIKELRGYIAEAKAYPYDNGLAHQLNEEAGESLEDLLDELESQIATNQKDIKQLPYWYNKSQELAAEVAIVRSAEDALKLIGR